MDLDRINELILDQMYAIKNRSIAIPLHDSIYQTIGSTTKTFTYKLNGITVATITLTYTDGSFTTLVSAIKT